MKCKLVPGSPTVPHQLSIINHLVGYKIVEFNFFGVSLNFIRNFIIVGSDLVTGHTIKMLFVMHLRFFKDV